MPLLETKDVLVAFGGLVALAGVSFRVEPDEIVGIIGPNGAGKTTLFNAISGVYKPGEGQVTFAGQTITGWSPDRICRAGISRTFQLVRVFPAITVLQNVLVGLHFGRQTSYNGSAMEGAWRYLEMVGLQDRAFDAAGSLNLAARKRIEIARALATDPRLLLLDEVIAGLNPIEVDEMMSLIRSIRDQGITVVLIEHVMKAIMSLSDRIMVLHHGEKIADGSPEEISRDPAVVSAYLGEVEL